MDVWFAWLVNIPVYRMLQSGLYDESPHTREIVYNQARLRALRVIVDVKVALGEFTQDQAAAFLEQNVPMSAASARTEVVEMNEAPGQKISLLCRQTSNH